MTREAPQRRSISLRMTAATVLLGLLASLAVTAIQIQFVYRNQVDTAQQQLDEIRQSTVPSLEAGLWQADDGRTELLLDALIETPGTGYVQLDSEGKRYTRGRPDVVPLVSETYRLSHDNGGKFDLGTLHVVIDNHATLARLRNAAIRELLTTTATLLTVSLLMLLLFRTWVTRHLEAMAGYADTLDIEHLQTPLALPRSKRHKHVDELDLVARALNHMRTRMIEELKVRTQHERELVMHRERLESLVRERTSELEEKTKLLELKSDELERLANTDSLTGVHSRRHFLDQFEQELARMRRGGALMAVMMLDVDHFKSINDTYGHAAGDRVLIRLAEICRQKLRQIDIIGRLGGEEFAVLLPRSDLTAAVATAERLRATLADLTVKGDRGEHIRFTVSIGVSRLVDAEENPASILMRADAQLYRAKHGGRNRVCVDEDAGPAAS